MQFSMYLVTTALLLTGPPTRPPGSSGSLEPAVIANCLVTVSEERTVSAPEPGLLMALEVKHGSEVGREDFVAQIDDRQAQSELRLAQKELELAEEQASNDVNVRYSHKSALVTEAIYQMSLSTNRKVADTVAKAQLLQQKYEWERAVLAIEQARLELTFARIKSEAAAERVRAAQESVERRRLLSPLSGEVVELYRKDGEWVNPADPILKIVQLERLRVEGFVDPRRYAPAAIDKRPVTVEFELDNGRRRTFDGKIEYVSFQNEPAGIRVWAEVINEREDGHWLLRPQMRDGIMTIHLGPVTAQRPSEAASGGPAFPVR